MQVSEKAVVAQADACAQTQFAKVPEWLLYARHADGKPIRGDEVLLYGVLARHRNEKTGRCNPSYSRLTQVTGFRRDKISQLLRGLERLGAIEADRPTPGEIRRSSQYRIQFDAPADDGPQPATSPPKRTIASKRASPANRTDTSTPKRTSTSTPKRTQTKALERDMKNDDVAHESEETKTRIDEIDFTLGGEPFSNKQRELVADGLAQNERLVTWWLKKARDARNPTGLFLSRLTRAREDGWTSTEIKKPTDPTIGAAAWAKNLGWRFHQPEFDEEIAKKVERGVDETWLRAEVEKHRPQDEPPPEPLAETPSDPTTANLFPMPTFEDDVVADAA
jgi:hypothetical protein